MIREGLRKFLSNRAWNSLQCVLKDYYPLHYPDPTVLIKEEPYFMYWSEEEFDKELYKVRGLGEKGIAEIKKGLSRYKNSEEYREIRRRIQEDKQKKEEIEIIQDEEEKSELEMLREKRDILLEKLKIVQGKKAKAKELLTSYDRLNGNSQGDTTLNLDEE